MRLEVIDAAVGPMRLPREFCAGRVGLTRCLMERSSRGLPTAHWRYSFFVEYRLLPTA